MGSVEQSSTSPDANHLRTLGGFRTSRDGLGRAKLDLSRREPPPHPGRVPNLPRWARSSKARPPPTRITSEPWEGSEPPAMGSVEQSSTSPDANHLRTLGGFRTSRDGL